MNQRENTWLGISAVFCLLILGCESGSTGSTGDTGEEPDLPTNNLGALCTMTGGECGGGHECVFLSAGNATQGSCSPICEVASDCIEGFNGTITGVADCNNIISPNPQNLTCTISCMEGAATDCPAGLACLAVGPGAPMRFCGVAAL